LFIILSINGYSQQAADFFPEQTGFTWNYRLSVLDSLNNVIPELGFLRKDSSAFIDEFEAREAYFILSKTGTDEIIQFLPYIDTNYIHLSGSNGYEYFDISEIEFLMGVIDSSLLNNIIPFLGLFDALSGWHLNYMFTQNVNQQYQITSYDTTVVINSTEVPLRFSKNGRRLQDENLETELGTFLCKKFLITNTLNYLAIPPPPLPPIPFPVPIITLRDTIWIAQDNWIVMDIIPSTHIDLKFLNLGEYIIPGLRREIISEVTGVNQEPEEKFYFKLEQNYPNPFNPLTRIKFNISDEGYVSVKVSDILGKEVATLFVGEIDAGNYEIVFNGENFSSGVYFYTLEFSDSDSELNYRITKQMLLIK
jgi:hypothetical protein